MSCKNFRNFKSIEHFIYKNAQDVVSGKITAPQANAASKLADSWIKAHKLKEESKIIRRLDGLETLLKIRDKKKSLDIERTISD